MSEAQKLIDLSRQESRRVTEYPDTQAEFDKLYDALLVECSDACCPEEGLGYSGPEARGHVTFWGGEGLEEWRVTLVRAPK
jgi:hypothetical protein